MHDITLTPSHWPQDYILVHAFIQYLPNYLMQRGNNLSAALSGTTFKLNISPVNQIYCPVTIKALKGETTGVLFGDRKWLNLVTPPSQLKRSAQVSSLVNRESPEVLPKIGGSMSQMYFSNVSSASCITMKTIQMGFAFLQNNSQAHKKLYNYIMTQNPEMFRSVHSSGIFYCIKQRKQMGFFLKKKKKKKKKVNKSCKRCTGIKNMPSSLIIQSTMATQHRQQILLLIFEIVILELIFYSRRGDGTLNLRTFKKTFQETKSRFKRCCACILIIVAILQKKWLI